MGAFFSLSHENWTIVEHPTALAAFALWNLNRIHPFIEGNGRTAGAAGYYLICMKQGRILGGKKTVPERIRENRNPLSTDYRRRIAHMKMDNMMSQN
jgi:Fic family protein